MVEGWMVVCAYAALKRLGVSRPVKEPRRNTQSTDLVTRSPRIADLVRLAFQFSRPRHATIACALAEPAKNVDGNLTAPRFSKGPRLHYVSWFFRMILGGSRRPAYPQFNYDLASGDHPGFDLRLRAATLNSRINVGHSPAVSNPLATLQIFQI